MDPQVQNPTKVATKWAFINLLFQIVITYAIQLLNFNADTPVRFLAYLPMVVCLLFAVKEFKGLQPGGYLAFGQAFAAGFRYFMFSGLMLAIFMYIYLAFLNPKILANTISTTQAIMRHQGKSELSIQKGTAMTKTWGPLYSAFDIAIWYAISGAVMSVLAALIFKKTPPVEVITSTDTDPTV